MEISNAKIESTMLGFEDHGIFTCLLYLDYGGSSQGFGQHCLASEHPKDKATYPFNYGANYIMGILKAVGVEKWEDLEGKYVRVKREDGWNGKIVAIGHIVEDNWFNPDDLLK
jgi:hypothetical protein